jgi:O-antigen biosynthesis protein
MEIPLPRVAYRSLAEYVRAAATHSTLLRTPYDQHDLRVLAEMEVYREAAAVRASASTRDIPVSVVLPVFNRSGVVSRAVLSVLTQTHRALQLVVVDDGSTDGTRQVIERFDDPRITYVAMDRNRGHAAARNRGLAEATGAYVAYIDSDDWWHPELVRVLLGVLIDRDAAFAYSAQRVLRPSRFDTALRPEIIRFSPYNRSLLENNNYISMISVLHRRDAAVTVGGFDESFRRYSDWNFFLRLSQAFPPVAVPALLSTYDQGTSGSVSGTEEREAARAHLLAVLGPHKLAASGLGVPSSAGQQLSEQLEAAFAGPASRPPAGTRRSAIVVLTDATDPVRLDACLRALDAFTPAHHPVTVAVVGDGAVRSDLERRTVALTQQSVGSALGTGLLTDHGADDVAVISDDVIVTPGWLEHLQAVLAAHPDVDVVVPRLVVPAGDPRARRHVPGSNPGYECDIAISSRLDNIVDPEFDGHGGRYELSMAPFPALLLNRSMIVRLAARPDRAAPGRLSAGSVWRELEPLDPRVVYTPDAKTYWLATPRSEAEEDAV